MFHLDSSSIENTFRDLPGIVSWKNVSSIYMGCNPSAVKLFGFKKDEQLIGNTDANLKCSASNMVDDFVLQDQTVLTQNKSIDIIDINIFSNGELSIFSTKKIPLINSDKTPIGILVQCIKVENPATIHSILKLSEADSKYKSRFGSYFLQGDCNSNVLTARERECLFYLLRGKSVPQIATILHRSKRTIETHIENIKQKTGCSNKSELIEASIQMGIHNYIPRSIFVHPMSLALNLKI